MKTTSILALGLIAGGFCLSGSAMAQTNRDGSTVTVASPAISVDRLSNGSHYPDKPNGVPPELHRKVVKLYKRIHNAYPDASRKRIFLKIAEELGIAPRRLWNAYHNPPEPNPGPVIVDARRVDPATDAQTRKERPVREARRDQVRDTRARDRASDRASDRVRDRRRVSDRRARPVRTRPQRGG